MVDSCPIPGSKPAAPWPDCGWPGYPHHALPSRSPFLQPERPPCLPQFPPWMPYCQCQQHPPSAPNGSQHSNYSTCCCIPHCPPSPSLNFACPLTLHPVHSPYLPQGLWRHDTIPPYPPGCYAAHPIHHALGCLPPPPPYPCCWESRPAYCCREWSIASPYVGPLTPWFQEKQGVYAVPSGTWKPYEASEIERPSGGEASQVPIEDPVERGVELEQQDDQKCVDVTEGVGEEDVPDEDEEEEDEGELVLTDEWIEFFARSEAKRQERKKQRRREAKLARRAVRQTSSLE